ncbi:MAG: chemotaxis protein CheW [Bacteroidota bacterium]
MSAEMFKIQTYLSFKMSEEVFAINVSKVMNILEMQHITRVPKTLPYMKGVINLRGTVLPVVDLRVKFGLPEKEFTVDTSIIVLNIEKEGDPLMLGILVDSVREVLEFKDEDIAPSPTIGTKYNSGFIQGMYRIDDRFIMILDIDKVFSVDDILEVKDYMTHTTV